MLSQTDPWSRFNQRQESLKKMWSAAEKLFKMATGKKARKISVVAPQTLKVFRGQRYKNPDEPNLTYCVEDTSFIEPFSQVYITHARDGDVQIRTYVATSWLLNSCLLVN